MMDDSDITDLTKVKYSKDPDFLRKMAWSPDEAVRIAIAQHTQTPSDALHKLSSDPELLIRYWVAWNPSTDVETLVSLARDPEGHVRRLVAKRRDTPPEVLQSMSFDPYYDVIEALANNHCTPAKALTRIFRGECSLMMREFLARNPNTPTDILEFLAREDTFLEKVVAQNSNAPTWVKVSDHMQDM